MSGLRSLARKQRQALHQLQQCRGYAKEVTLVAGDPIAHTKPRDPAFLRFATPFPQAYNHQQVLGLIPETRVGHPPLNRGHDVHSTAGIN